LLDRQPVRVPGRGGRLARGAPAAGGRRGRARAAPARLGRAGRRRAAGGRAGEGSVVSAGRTHVRLAAALAAGALLLAPSAALAHAQLQDTSPQRGAVVRTQPAQVSFRFDEAVEGTFGAVRVYDGTGRRVDAGDAFHPGGRGPVMAVHLKPQLPAGTYTATYRVVSADGHIVSSGFVFSIGHPSATRQTVGQLIGAG